MAGIIGSTSPCVQVVDTEVRFFYGVPFLPWQTEATEDSGTPPSTPHTYRNLYVFKILITCPGIWTVGNTSFTYTNVYGETMPMSMVDINNSFPIVLPENETIEVEIAWDFHWDGIVGAGHNPGSYSSLVQYALNYCVSLIITPYNAHPPPPPGAGFLEGYEDLVAYPWPEDWIPGNADPGAPTDLPGETAPTGSNSGSPHIPGSDGDVNEGAENAGDYDENASGGTSTTVPNIAVADMYRLPKYDVKGRFIGDTKDIVNSAGTRPAINKPDKPSTQVPIAGIAEPREIHFTQLYNKSGLHQNSFGPGQAFVPRVKNSNVIDNLVYLPNKNQVVGKKNKVKPVSISDKSVGNRVNINSTISNPNIDINLKEPHGANNSVDNFNTYVTKDPKAGSRLESVPFYNYRESDKLDSKGRPIKSSQTRKDGQASSSPKSSFNLFSTKIPKDKNIPFLSRRSTRQIAQTSGNQDYEIPLSNDDFTIVDDSNIIYNAGQGLFYGVGPFETIESDEFLEGLYNLVPSKDGIKTFVTVNDSSIVESNLVTPASIGIQNNSFHQTEHNVLIVLGILDSEVTFRYIGYNYINILPRSYQFMNAVIPPGLPPGAAKVVGMVFNSNNKLILSEIEEVIIAPDGYTVEGYTPFSPSIPASLANLANNPDPLHGGRVFDSSNKRRYKALSDTVDVIVKSPQIAITRGLDAKITASDLSATSESSSRYTIDGVEIFAGSHEAYLQFNTTSGNNVDIEISDVTNKSHSTYAFNVFGSNLETPPLVFSGIANESGYLGGHIQTNVINGKILLENNRTAISVSRFTTESGYIILNTTGGWNQTGSVVTQVDPTETPFLGFDTLPGDTINIYAEGIGGSYNDLIVQEVLLPDANSELPTGAYTLPDEANIPVPIPTQNPQGDNIPQPNPPADPSPLPGTDPDNPNPPPESPPGDPLPTNGECTVPAGDVFLWRSEIVSICQRPTNPCIIDITANLYMCDFNGNPIGGLDHYAKITDYCAFSLNSTNGTDGDWYKLVPLMSDNEHSGIDPIAMPGTYNFVADMCDHFSSFFSVNSIMFKLIFRSGSINSAGDFAPDCSNSEIEG